MTRLSLSRRDMRALALLAFCAVLFSAIYLWPEQGEVVGAEMTSAQMEQRITRLRRMAAAAPGREEALRRVQEELGRREAGMLKAESVAQAQAEMLEMVRRVAKSQPETFGLRGTEFGVPRRLGDHYGEVVLTVSVDCPIDRLVSFLADVSNQPELIAVSDVQLSMSVGNKKIIPARLTFTGIVPRRLVPEKQGGPAF